MADEHDPLRPHSHEPNPTPPTAEATITFYYPNGHHKKITVADLKEYPVTSVADCFIVSTGHGTSGPFTFTGTPLWIFISRQIEGVWDQAEVISADGFGNRVWRHELETENDRHPIILAYEINGRPLTRQEGLVRLIVPSEKDDALRQVKWVSEIKVRQNQE